MDDETLVWFGGEVKALGNGKVGGNLVVHSTHRDPDLALDYFDKKTNYGPHRQTPILYNHGFDTKVGPRTLGMAQIEISDAGVWLEGQLELRDAYEKNIYKMVEDGKLGWSSGTAAHLVEREVVGKSYHIKTWPLGLDASLTPTPAEPRTAAVSLKSLIKSSGVSADDKRTLLMRAIRAKMGSDNDEFYCYVCDLYDTSVVWSTGGQYFEANYEISGTSVTLGTPKEVARLVTYRTVADSPAKTHRPTERHFEEFLRDAGFSRRDATAITLHGFKALQRDAGTRELPDLDALKRTFLQREAAAYAALAGG